jgi:hypothetical protein
VEQGHSHFVDGRLELHAGEVQAVLSAVVAERSYDIMKFNLEKRLSDAELPIAGLFLWARLCMVSCCYSLMAKSCRVNTVKA